MRYKYGNTVCISTQAGCRMGCSFCASPLNGFRRNLTAGEMLEQVMAVMRDTGEKVTGIVLMGIGEPLDNYDNVLRFLRLRGLTFHTVIFRFQPAGWSIKSMRSLARSFR